MKICVISFDFWNYDEHIVDELRRKGIEAHHINIGAYKHKSFQARVQNTFSKIVLHRNIKNERRQEMIIEELSNLGYQDQILVINPELIARSFHEQIKKLTSRYIAYLYDSLARCPAEHLFDLFDQIFTFDQTDAANHHFRLISNYNYLHEEAYQPSTKFDLVYLASYDKRTEILSRIISKLESLELTYQAKIVGKKTWKKTLVGALNSEISYSINRIKHWDIPLYYRNGKVILDLIRDNQTGLSFRFFEAMALKKKIVTNNKTVKDYDFYNPKNILVLNDDLSNFEKSFFETAYQELDPQIYRKYTIETWVDNVFNLD